MAYQRLQTTDQQLNRIQDNIEQAYRDLESYVVRYSEQLTGDVTVNEKVTTIGVGKVTNAMLAGGVTNSKTTATPLNTALAIVSRDASGNFAASTLSLTAVNTTGVSSLGNTATAGKHLIQGNNPGNYQLEVKNNNTSAFTAGLRVAILNSTSGSVIQDWTVNGAIVGSLQGDGVFNIGPAFPGTTYPGNRVRGVTNGSAATAGDVGEIISATPGVSVNAVTSNIPFTVVSIALTAGDWDVSGTVVFAANGATTTASLWCSAISLSPNSFDIAGGNALTGFPIVAGTNSVYMPTPTRRITITGAGTTPAYLVARLTYSAGTPTAHTESHISARRMR